MDLIVEKVTVKVIDKENGDVYHVDFLKHTKPIEGRVFRNGKHLGTWNQRGGLANKTAAIGFIKKAMEE
jgi:hypothetical protein